MGTYADFVSIAHTHFPTKETSTTSFVLIFSATGPLLTSPRRCFIIPWKYTNRVPFTFFLRDPVISASFTSLIFSPGSSHLPCEVLHNCYLPLLRVGLVKELTCPWSPLTSSDSRESLFQRLQAAKYLCSLWCYSFNRVGRALPGEIHVLYLSIYFFWNILPLYLGDLLHYRQYTCLTHLCSSSTLLQMSTMHSGTSRPSSGSPEVWGSLYRGDLARPECNPAAFSSLSTFDRWILGPEPALLA